MENINNETCYVIVDSRGNVLIHTIRYGKQACINFFVNDETLDKFVDWNHAKNGFGFKCKKVKVTVDLWKN